MPLRNETCSIKKHKLLSGHSILVFLRREFQEDVLLPRRMSLSSDSPPFQHRNDREVDNLTPRLSQARPLFQPVLGKSGNSFHVTRIISFIEIISQIFIHSVRWI